MREGKDGDFLEHETSVGSRQADAKENHGILPTEGQPAGPLPDRAMSTLLSRPVCLPLSRKEWKQLTGTDKELPTQYKAGACPQGA